jgi:hypothetical protein
VSKSEDAGKYRIENQQAPGQVIGDHATVHQHYYGAPRSKQPKDWRSPAVLIGLFLLALTLLGGGSLSIYRATIGSWPWDPPHGQLTPPSHPSSASSLIPSYAPVLSDPLMNTSNPYRWDIGQQESVRCSIVPGSGYHVSTSANALGKECNTNPPVTVFINFVYQIKMQIIKGLKGSGGVGPTFCVSSTNLGGSYYSISFNVYGTWTFGYRIHGITIPRDTTLSTGHSPYFLSGDGRVNYITVRVQERQIDAQINSHPLFSISNSKLSAGMIGVQIDRVTEDSDVVFSDARVWKL